ncbi:MAG: hypothetical protein KF802_15275 [Bdellovibrionaceae bacterium]|nr:hypothetical protein [Pseudobdellovibrionaceae bacterium]MBX3033447.1 hypothetical protein [Pseudobdellovibrionaceae bacterium]
MNDTTLPWMIAGLLLISAALPPLWRGRARLRGPRELEPNCLLTKSPVIFVSGPRALFGLAPGWDDLPVHLLAHGYDVRILRLPRRGEQRRQEMLCDLLNQQPGHLVVDQETLEEMRDILQRLRPASIIVPCGPSHEERKRDLLQSVRREAEREWEKAFAERVHLSS